MYKRQLISLVGSGILSKESGIELNTASKPDEKARIEKEEQQKRELEASATENVTIQENMSQQTATSATDNSFDNSNSGKKAPIN